MSTIGDDCYFFCTSTCSKGVNCPFRHVETAKTCRIICQHWQLGGCFRPMCKFRHSDFPLQINTAEVPCHWETQPSGCIKTNCPYKHSKPRPVKDEAAVKTTTTSQTPSEKSSTENEKNNPALQFVRPVVDPVVIHPDSEASNSSPVKSSERMKKIPPPSNESITQKAISDVTEAKSKKDDNVNGTEQKDVKVEKKRPLSGSVKKKAKVPLKKTDSGKKNVKTKTVRKTQGEPTKSISKPAVAKKKVVPKSKLNVKERLGKAAREREETESQSEGSDSDDSIENVKVLSMEEIFRQKALESMMKKRAAEGKPMLPASGTGTKNKPVTSSVKSLKSSNNKKAPVPERKVFQQESEDDEEDESEEEEDDEDKQEESEEDSEEEEDSSADSSSSDSSESSESEEETDAPRRVIIDVDNHKKSLRRKKAKENLLKRMPVKSNVRVKKREVLREPVSEEEPALKKSKNMTIHQRLGLQQRLKKPISVTEARVVDQTVKKPAQKRKLIIQNDDEDDDKGLGKIKIKSLEEIQAEKMRRLQFNQISGNHSPEKVQPLKRTIMLKDEDNPSSLSDPGQAKTETKKVKKRPWKKPKIAPLQQAVEEDHRTVSSATSIATMDNTRLTIVSPKNHEEETSSAPESPTESLRRRALLKKALSQGVSGEKTAEILETSSSKKSKHKHKHKHKKKSKNERQLYVPPALKNTEGGKKEFLGEETEEPSDLRNLPIDDAPKAVAPRRAVAQRVGALWAAGLNVSSKGQGMRIVPPKIDPQKEMKPPVVGQKSSLTFSKVKKPAPSDDLPAIKTFSQIMAEKRQKRLQQQQQQQKPNTPPSLEKAQASLPVNSKPRVPVVTNINSGNASQQREGSSIKNRLKTQSQEASRFPSLFTSGSENKDTMALLSTEEPKKYFKKMPANSDLQLQHSTRELPQKDNDKKDDVHISPSILSKSLEAETLSEEKEHKRRSTEDEFSFFEGDDFDDGAIPEDVEPIDDLLQDIDDLLA